MVVGQTERETRGLLSDDSAQSRGTIGHECRRVLRDLLSDGHRHWRDRGRAHPLLREQGGSHAARGDRTKLTAVL